MTLIQTTTCDAHNCDRIVAEYIGDGWVRIPEGQTAWHDADNRELFCAGHANPDTDSEIEGEVQVF